MKISFSPGLAGVLILWFLVMIDSAFAKPTVLKSEFGKTAKGKVVELFTLRNSSGVEARIITYGGTLVSLSVPDREGRFGDVVLGFDSVEAYEKQQSYIGPIIGRYANRIAGAKFLIDGRQYKLATNDGDSNLHGGPMGFDRVVWKGKALEGSDEASVVLTYTSSDGDQGFPGKLKVRVIYTLTENNELKLEYHAVTNKPTVVNLTQHAYFNLAGAGVGTIVSHELQIFADFFTPIDSNMIPTGELKNVAGTPFDFLKPHPIADFINGGHEQIRFGRGYDHNWVLAKTDNRLSLAARLIEPDSGRIMEVLTTERGLQFYSGNHLDGEVSGKDGQVYSLRTGLCLEAQRFPDSPNRANFTPAVLRKGETYSQTTIYRFYVQK